MQQVIKIDKLQSFQIVRLPSNLRVVIKRDFVVQTSTAICVTMLLNTVNNGAMSKCVILQYER